MQPTPPCVRLPRSTATRYWPGPHCKLRHFRPKAFYRQRAVNRHHAKLRICEHTIATLRDWKVLDKPCYRRQRAATITQPSSLYTAFRSTRK